MKNSTKAVSPIPAFVQLPAVRILLGIAAVIVPVVVVQFAVIALPVGRLPKNILLGVLTPPVVFWIYSLFVRRLERRDVTELAIGGSIRELSLGLLCGAVLILSVFGILAAVGAYSIVAVNDWQIVLISMFATIGSAVLEEVLFRGILFRILEEGLGTWIALVVSALIFGGLHLVNPNANLAGAVSIILTAGLLLGAAYMLTRRLWLPIGIHYAANFLQAGIFGGPVSGGEAGQALFSPAFHGPDWLTGGRFGIEASLVTVVLGAVAAALLLWAAARKGQFRRPASSPAKP